MKKLVLLVVLLAVLAAGMAPQAAFAHDGHDGAAEEIAAEEIAVTGVLRYDGVPPVYGIIDETTIYGRNRHDGALLGVGYQLEGLEGDYSAYKGLRITVYGTPRHESNMRLLDVSSVELAE